METTTDMNPTTEIRSRRSESGFALILVLLVLVGMTVLGAGGWIITHSDFSATQNQRTALDAFYVANAGLEEYIANHQGFSPAGATYTYPRGTATVSVHHLRTINKLQSVWRIESTGTHPLANGGTAERTVGVIAMLNANTVKFPSSFTSATGLTKNGNAGEISGYDHATSGQCPGAGNDDTNGVATPVGHPYEQSGGGSLVPEGSPKDTAVVGSQQELLESTGIDWESLVNGELFQFDYTYSEDGWPDYSSMSSDEFPIVYMDTGPDGTFDMGPSHQGRGMLIIRGDLKMSGNFEWEGPILVGGSVTTDGKQRIEGGIVSGFNLLLGESVGQSSIGNGNKDILFHSCWIHAAMKGTANFVQKKHTWHEVM